MSLRHPPAGPPAVAALVDGGRQRSCARRCARPIDGRRPPVPAEGGKDSHGQGNQIGGLVSGLDTQSIITRMMSIERQPRADRAARTTVVQARQDSLKAINTKLKALKTSDVTSVGSSWSLRRR